MRRVAAMEPLNTCSPLGHEDRSAEKMQASEKTPVLDSIECVDDNGHHDEEHIKNQIETEIEREETGGTNSSCDDQMNVSGHARMLENLDRASNSTNQNADRIKNGIVDVQFKENHDEVEDNVDSADPTKELIGDMKTNCDNSKAPELDEPTSSSETDHTIFVKQEPEIETDDDLYQQPKRSRKSRKPNKPMRIVATVDDDETSAYISDDDGDINDETLEGIKGSTVGIIAKAGLEIVKNNEKYWEEGPVNQKQVPDNLSTIKLAYSCKECTYTTDYKSHLHRHMNAHTGYKPFVCFVCGLEYSRSEKVRWHVFRHHPNEQYDILKCKKENLNKPSASLSLKTLTKVRTSKEASKGALPADGEGKGSDTVTKDTSSTKTTDSNLDKVVCKECGYKSNCAYSLSRHIKEVHQKVATFSCPLCDYGTNRRYRFINHMIKHGVLHCCFCSHVSSDQIGYECHLTACKVKTTSVTFPCDHCTDTFGSKKQLSLHLGENHQIYQFKCTQCDFKSNFHGLFEKHEKKHTKRKVGRPMKMKVKLPNHNGPAEMGIKCELCEMHLKNNHSYLKHKRQAHSGSKPYSCHECDFETESEIALMNHLRIHTGTKLSCYETDCTYKSSFSGSLARHMAEVHEIVPRHLCPLCPKDFRCQTKLYYHLQAHNEAFTCSKCDSKFYLDAAFKMHQEVCEGPISRERFNPSLVFNDLNENKTSVSPIHS